MSTFSEWLQHRHKERRHTREEFAERIDCSVSMLRKIESDERRPSVQIAERIANALEIPAAERLCASHAANGASIEFLPHRARLASPDSRRLGR